MPDSSSRADRIVSMSAIFISLLTLCVFVYQTTLIHKQQRMSVLPNLQIGNSGYGSKDFAIVMENTGVGPAIIESVQIQYGGKTFDMDLPSFLFEHTDKLDSIRFRYSNIGPGQLIPAGRKVEILKSTGDKENAVRLTQALQSLRETDLDLKIVYRSIYDERWMLTGESHVPQKLE